LNQLLRKIIFQEIEAKHLGIFSEFAINRAVEAVAKAQIVFFS